MATREYLNNPVCVYSVLDAVLYTCQLSSSIDKGNFLDCAFDWGMS